MQRHRPGRHHAADPGRFAGCIQLLRLRHWLAVLQCAVTSVVWITWQGKVMTEDCFMRKRAPNVEWQIAQSDADWERWREPALPDLASAASRRRRLKYYVWGAAALLLLLAGTGNWWWRTTQAP